MQYADKQFRFAISHKQASSLFIRFFLLNTEHLRTVLQRLNYKTLPLTQSVVKHYNVYANLSSSFPFLSFPPQYVPAHKVQYVQYQTMDVFFWTVAHMSYEYFRLRFDYMNSFICNPYFFLYRPCSSNSQYFMIFRLSALPAYIHNIVSTQFSCLSHWHNGPILHTIHSTLNSHFASIHLNIFRFKYSNRC